MPSNNAAMSESFYKYCQEHPEQRFWQALRNWTQENIDADCGFIMVADSEFNNKVWNNQYEEAITYIKDTFYWEDDKLGQVRESR